ncbi:hypothetical protein ELI13_30505 (plasmid) [Rhizobium ruizarguesonis]|jgi:hypothetical protein|uniref:AbiTii domain-containing protein n=1 Tax=Rhizobium ruizarguesonis TaxID=2081791 RepID=A0ABY1X1I0_9HYPH|nr:hypothetical protein [Rhizobium ruizarguesonis]TAU58401.1 hypothetical protein ELI46_39335 [Rhizobium ruizarguesonis]TAV18903.1 hypothetical protein ELI36_38135 [Rhizobium ruizarguesonis]TAV20049.1 hypothetical protein ELI33_37995 [Rhizobium ruizarguesonis]TAW49311.1 hypothetical protein ELI15_29430 [Rhizobium ruizarguesonis]TAW83987.1 hypothetical protein ELI13_30505 [Rhizobium ruizarguesonis]
MADRAPQDGNFPFREKAREHLATAEKLLCGQGQQLIYACLELRLAIEAIAYDTLQTYEKNLSREVADAYEHWQPSKILQLLSTHDPLVNISLRVQIREAGEDGAPVGGDPMFDGIDRRLTVPWVEKAHRSLGSFLHQRTISQLKKGKAIDEAKVRTEASRIVIMIREVLASEVYGIKLSSELSMSICGSISD